MGIKITWAPSGEADIASYNLERSDTLTTPLWTLLINVPHNLLGPNYDTLLGVFWYLDSTGDTTKYYRLTSIDTVNQLSIPSTPFQPVSTAPAIPNIVKVDHNTPTPGNLRYQTAGGIPVEAAVIRVYKKSDFDAGNTDTPLAVTMTNVQGNWVNPISLTTGFTYVVQFAKEGLYGPDKTEVTI
jgi:hypothetical protein